MPFCWLSYLFFDCSGKEKDKNITRVNFRLKYAVLADPFEGNEFESESDFEYSDGIVNFNFDKGEKILLKRKKWFFNLTAQRWAFSVPEPINFEHRYNM